MNCVARVRATLEDLDGVQDVLVDFKVKSATITMKEGSLKQETVTSALKKAGYRVTSFKDKKTD